MASDHDLVPCPLCPKGRHLIEPGYARSLSRRLDGPKTPPPSATLRTFQPVGKPGVAMWDLTATSDHPGPLTRLARRLRFRREARHPSGGATLGEMTRRQAIEQEDRVFTQSFFTEFSYTRPGNVTSPVTSEYLVAFKEKGYPNLYVVLVDAVSDQAAIATVTNRNDGHFIPVAVQETKYIRSKGQCLASVEPVKPHPSYKIKRGAGNWFAGC